MTDIAGIADKLALEVIAAAEALDDDRLVNEIAQVLGASSPSTEEAFRTAARVRMAENGSAKVCHGSGGIVLLRAE
jgi:hypothetical protein